MKSESPTSVDFFDSIITRSLVDALSASGSRDKSAQCAFPGAGRSREQNQKSCFCFSCSSSFAQTIDHHSFVIHHSFRGPSFFFLAFLSYCFFVLLYFLIYLSVSPFTFRRRSPFRHPLHSAESIHHLPFSSPRPPSLLGLLPPSTRFPDL